MRLAPLLATLLAALCAAAASGCSDVSTRAADRDRPPRPERVSAARAARLPNVIFIYTDDQNLSEFKRRYMPRTFRLLADRGTVFSDFVVATPICCPSRASYLTGSYPHNDGVFSNRGGYSQLRGKYNSLPVWMRNAGYRTVWLGKYLQGYETGVEDPLRAAPGIDDWHASFDPRYYDYELAVNGRSVRYGSRSRDYYTTVLTRLATEVIERQAERRRPLYMNVNNLAPHHGSGHGGRCTDLVVPAPRDRDAYGGAPLPRGPSFDEVDRSDKPRFVQEKKLSQAKLGRLRLLHGCRLASLRAIDREVAAIHTAVKRAGELSDTVFIFTSDNGLLLGEHGLSGKNVPYEEGIHMPLAILAGKRALGGRAVAEAPELTANVDLAPTILDLADAEPCARAGNCRELDGTSLVPLLRGERGAITSNREVLIEGGKGGGDCLYAGIRTPQLSYVEHAEESSDGGCDREARGIELYDLDGSLTGQPDPHQLENLASPAITESRDPAVRAELRRLDGRLAELRRCAGASCLRP